jgi:hypothetical protein
MNSREIIISVAFLIGLTMGVTGWLLFRHPGVSAWSSWSLRRPTDYASPLGVFLHYAGFTIVIISIVLLYVL